MAHRDVVRAVALADGEHLTDVDRVGPLGVPVPDATLQAAERAIEASTLSRG